MSRRVPAWARTVRFRLTVTWSVVLFALGSVVVGSLYVGLRARVADAPVANQIPVTGIRGRDGQIRPITNSQLVITDLRDVERQVNARTLEQLRTYSFEALAFLFVASLVVGWVLAGRALAPIERIRRVADHIQGGDLSQRIALAGPDDELHRLADTFDAMLGRLQAAFDAQQRLIDDTSHELRNPLAVIRTNLQVTLDDPDASVEELRQTGAVVKRASDRMAGLVDDLLASARRQAAARRTDRVDLAEVAAETADEFEATARGRGLTLERSVPSGVLVEGDRDALKRAVVNLVDNAVRLAPSGTAITLTGGRVDGQAWLSVVDRGPGIDPADQPLVFHRFWRPPGAAGGAQGRSGLGLAIVRQIVEGHGGRVGLRSAVGVGSEFTLWLPADASAEGTGA